jgi:hypothetical protein
VGPDEQAFRTAIEPLAAAEPADPRTLASAATGSAQGQAPAEGVAS